MDRQLLLRSMAIAHFIKTDKKLHEIIPGLYLGSCGAAYNQTGIEAAGITHILCIATNIMSGIQSHNKELDLKYLEVAIDDKPTTRITEQFDECFEFMEEGLREGGVLVHCFQGKSRSSTVIIAFLMKRQGWSFERALEFVRDKRSVVAPNIGFSLQLRKFENHLKGGAVPSPTSSEAVKESSEAVKESSSVDTVEQQPKADQAAATLTNTAESAPAGHQAGNAATETETSKIS